MNTFLYFVVFFDFRLFFETICFDISVIRYAFDN